MTASKFKMNLQGILKLFTALCFAGMLVSISSCSYYGTYEYRILNELDDTLYIDFSRNTWYPTEVKDSNLTIAPHESNLILSTMSEELDKGEDPGGIEDPSIPEFNYIKLTVNGKELDKDFKEISYWDYSTKGSQTGVYQLNVDSLLIK